MSTGVQKVSVRDNSRIREIFAKVPETIISGERRHLQKAEYDAYSF